MPELNSLLLRSGALLTVTFIGAALWAWAPDRPRAALEEKYVDRSMRYLEVGGTVLRVQDSGPKDATAVILIHGFGSSLETWAAWTASLRVHHRVVSFDLPGCGLSAADRSHDYGDARSVSLIQGLMDQLGIERAVLVGNSLGGRIAWRFAVALPARVSKLVLISPDGFASPGFQYGKAPQVSALLNVMRYFLPKAALRMNLAAAYADPRRLSDGVVDRYYDLMLAPGNRAAILDRMRQSVLQDPVPLLRQIRTSTLLLWGEKDRLIPYANSADYLAALPNATLVSLTDLGHVPHEEAPSESLPPVERFLAD